MEISASKQICRTEEDVGDVPKGRSIDRLTVYRSFDASPEADLRLEEDLLDTCPSDAARLLIYHWSRPTVVLGRGQDAADVSEAVCDTLGIPVIRRRSGGTAVLHTRTLNVSLILPASHPAARRISGVYDLLVDAVGGALRRNGIAAVKARPGDIAQDGRSAVCFERDAGETLLFEGKKVFGCAQRRRKHAVLVHGALLLGLDAVLHSRVFGVPAARIRSAMTHIPDCRPEEIADATVKEIARVLGGLPVLKEVEDDRK